MSAKLEKQWWEVSGGRSERRQEGGGYYMVSGFWSVSGRSRRGNMTTTKQRTCHIEIHTHKKMLGSKHTSFVPYKYIRTVCGTPEKVNYFLSIISLNRLLLFCLSYWNNTTLRGKKSKWTSSLSCQFKPFILTAIISYFQFSYTGDTISFLKMHCRINIRWVTKLYFFPSLDFQILKISCYSTILETS